jgi:hypothetical protein
MMLVSAAAYTASASSGMATVTKPAPMRAAARAAKRAAPVLGQPPHTSAWPRLYLWLSGCSAGKAFSHKRPNRSGRADIGHHQLAAKAPTRLQQVTRLLAKEGHGQRGGHGAQASAAIAQQAARHIDRDKRQTQRRSSGEGFGSGAVQGSAKAGAKQRVDHQLGTREHGWSQRFNRAGPSRRMVGRITAQPAQRQQRRHPHRPAGLLQGARGHEAVAAVVAGAAEHHHSAPRPALLDGSRHGSACLFHQGNAGHAGLPTQAVGLRHLGAGQQG